MSGREQFFMKDFQNSLFSSPFTLNLNGRIVDLSSPQIMGVLNVTPDSFYDGGQHTSPRAILTKTERMIEEGASIIDVGGYSSRPGAKEILVEEELFRTIAAVKIIKNTFPEVIISVDTFRAEVAHAAVLEGAEIINDISGGTLDKNMFAEVKSLKVPYILMHMKGTPQTMNNLARYDDLLKEIVDYFHIKIALLTDLGISDIIVDPGFGFAKTVQHNYELLNNLSYLRILERPLLVGLSRKSMIWRTLDITPEEALNGTTVLNTVALLRGASILRVHDVKEAKQIVRLMSNL